MNFEGKLGEIHIQDLEGLGASYRVQGYFELKLNSEQGLRKFPFTGVAFGGHYGGHNINIELSPEDTKTIQADSDFHTQAELDTLLSEVQRRILNGDMVVEFDKLKQEAPNVDPFGNISS